MKKLSERRIKQILADDASALIDGDFTPYEFEQALREIIDLRAENARLAAELARAREEIAAAKSVAAHGLGHCRQGGRGCKVSESSQPIRSHH